MLRTRNDIEKAERREKLLDAAQAVFFRKGFENTVMKDISKEAGFSRALLYVYFKDKRALYEGLRLRASKALLERFKERAETAETGLDAVSSCGHAYYAFYRDQRDFFDCLTLHIGLDSQQCHDIFGPDSDATTEQAIDVVARTEMALMEVMVEALQRGKRDGSIDPDKCQDEIEVGLFLRGAMHGVIMLIETSRALQSGGQQAIDSLINSSIERLRLTLQTSP